MAISLRPITGTGRVIASAAALDFRSRRVTVSNHKGCVRPDRRLQQRGLPVSPAPPKRPEAFLLLSRGVLPTRPRCVNAGLSAPWDPAPAFPPPPALYFSALPLAL